MEVLKKGIKREEWMLCPTCGKKTRDWIREDTVIVNYPLYCPKCEQTTIIHAKDFHVTTAKEHTDV